MEIKLNDCTLEDAMEELNIEQRSMNASWLNDGKGGLLRAWIGIRWKS